MSVCVFGCGADVHEGLGIQTDTLKCFLLGVQDRMLENPFHNWCHVVDVMQVAFPSTIKPPSLIPHPSSLTPQPSTLSFRPWSLNLLFCLKRPQPSPLNPYTLNPHP